MQGVFIKTEHEQTVLEVKIQALDVGKVSSVQGIRRRFLEEETDKSKRHFYAP